MIKPRQRGLEEWEVEASLREQKHQYKVEVFHFCLGAALLFLVIVLAVTTQQQWLPSVIAGSYASLITVVFPRRGQGGRSFHPVP